LFANLPSNVSLSYLSDKSIAYQAIACYYMGVGKGNGPAGGDTPRSPAHRKRIRTVDTRSIEYGEVTEQDHPHACSDGYVYLGYTDDDGEEQIEKLPCRRCVEEGS
jgi:hypothetical protein